MNGDRPSPEAIAKYRALIREVADSVFEESQLPRDEIRQILADVGVSAFAFAEAVRRRLPEYYDDDIVRRGRN